MAGARRTRRSKAHREFVSEAEEILDRMRDALSELAEAHGNGGEPAPETVNDLFRSAHSLKGLSGMFGLEVMSELAHHLEEVLDRLRLGRTELGNDGLAIFDDAVGLMASALEKMGDAASEESVGLATAELIGRIDEWQAAPTEKSSDLAELDVPASLLRTLTEYEEHRLRESLRRGRAIHVVEVDFEISAFEQGLEEVSATIREAGEVISTLPSSGDTPDSQIRFSLLSAVSGSAAELASQLGLEADAVRQVRAAADAEAAGQEPSGSSQSAASTEASDSFGSDAGSSEGQTLKSISETVRVDIRKLDELMNLVGELSQHRGSLRGILGRLAADSATARAAVELDKVYRDLDRKLQELQAGVLDVRMVPLQQVFDKLSRVVRRLRVDLGKEVRLDISGADTELDKLIVEELVDPLMHVVRNAFDHAIEPADERRAAGKPAEGRISIEALQRGNDVVISVRDDGRGIDAERVRARAEERGLVSEDADLSERELLDLVFHPGLSTRDQVTETSGRGVGMDVVRTNIASLGGMVHIESKPGSGTAIHFTLPITLAIIKALIVGVADQHFAIPLNSVRETLLVEPSEIQRSEGRELLNLRGEALPLRRLAQEFELGPVDRSQKQYAVVLAIGEARLGLLVDRPEGQQDAVIKAIQGPISRVRGIAGATELGEQGAILVLDVAGFLEESVRRGEDT
jgi:two-component system chemotaxis sensor kinase CheA